MTPETYWLSLGILLIFIEVLSGSLWVGFFGIGAVITAAFIFSGMFETLNTQIAVFLVFSGLSLGFLRTPIKTWLYRESQPKTFGNPKGKQVVVTQAILEGGSGRVSHQGTTWDAESHDGSSIPAESRAEIVRVEGSRLFVRKLEN